MEPFAKSTQIGTDPQSNPSENLPKSLVDLRSPTFRTEAFSPGHTVEKLVAKRPILLASDEKLVTITADEINTDTVADVVSPISETAFDTATTTSSPEIIVERTRLLHLSAGKQAKARTVEAVKAEHKTTPRIAASPLRGDAEEFIPRQAYSPSIGSPEGSFLESPSTTPYNVRMDARSTSHPAALQTVSARPQHTVSNTRDIQLFPTEWATRSLSSASFPCYSRPLQVLAAEILNSLARTKPTTLRRP